MLCAGGVITDEHTPHRFVDVVVALACLRTWTLVPGSMGRGVVDVETEGAHSAWQGLPHRSSNGE